MYTGLTLGGVHSVFGQMRRVTQSLFTALKLVCVPPAPPPSPQSWQTPVVHCLHRCALSNTSYGGNYAAWSLFRLFFTWESALKTPPSCFSWLDGSFLSRAEDYSILRMVHGLFTHAPAEGHRGCVRVFVITKEAAVNIRVRGFVWT